MTDSNNIHKTDDSKSSILAGYSAVAVVSVLVIIKVYAYYQTSSVSVLSSLTDSVLDSIISIIALGSVYYARRPADQNHRWGHGKMEAVSALFQAAMIAAGGAFLVFEAVGRLDQPIIIYHHKTGIYVMLISIFMSAILVVIQRISLKKRQSMAIEADSLHYSSDIFINLGALIVLFFSMKGAPQWLDACFAVGVAVFMVIIARGIALKALNVLLDRELPEEDRTNIIKVIEAHKQVIGWHDLRTYQNGINYVISFDIEVDPDLSLWAAHSIAGDLEEGVLEVYPSADIMIHVDPKGAKQDARHRVKGVHISI